MLVVLPVITIVTSVLIVNTITNNKILLVLSVIFVCIFSYNTAITRTGGDNNLGYVHDVQANQQMINYSVENQLNDEKIAAPFLMRCYLTNYHLGYVTKDATFTNITSDIDSTTKYYIQSNKDILPNIDNNPLVKNKLLLKCIQIETTKLELYQINTN